MRDTGPTPSTTPSTTSPAALSADRSPDRRSEPGLRFDPTTGRLALGSTSVDVAIGAGNREVLQAYVDLAARSRDRAVAELIEVRQGDVDALAAALDLDAADLGREIEQVLGATRAEAIRLVSRLRESRVIGGITKAATAGVLAGTLLAGGPTVTAAQLPPAAQAATETSPPIVDGPLTEDESGVGLIPPVTEEASGAVLIPPLSVDRDDPSGS